MKNMNIFEQSVKMRKGIKVPNYKKKRVKARENMKFSRLKIENSWCWCSFRLCPGKMFLHRKNINLHIFAAECELIGMQTFLMQILMPS